MNIEAYGTFHAFNTKIFRTDSYLRIGSSSKPIGLVVMLNPGSSRLANDSDWNSFLHRCEAGEEFTETNKLKMDPTMESIIDIISMINPGMQGILRIYNLFNYRCGNSEEAIRTYSTFIKDPKMSSFLHSPLPTIKTFPWIWTAWSVKDDAVLNNRKLEILNNIPHKKKIALYSRQKKHQKKKELYCYHPSPQKKETKAWVHTSITKEFEEFYTLSNN